MGVSPENIRRGGQDTKAHFKFARRVAIYLIYVDLRLTVRDVAAIVGVSRETVSNAISDIDDYQDIDPAFEVFLLEVLRESGSGARVIEKPKSRPVTVAPRASDIVADLGRAINASGRSTGEIFMLAGSSRDTWKNWRSGSAPNMKILQRVAAVLGKRLVLTDAD